jgi:hypothetical protein
MFALTWPRSRPLGRGQRGVGLTQRPTMLAATVLTMLVGSCAVQQPTCTILLRSRQISEDLAEIVVNEQEVGVIVNVSGRVSLASVEDGPSGHGKRLVVLKDGNVLGSVDVPPRVSAAALDAGLKGVLRHPNGIDLAAGFEGDKGSFVVVFLQQASGSYLAVDVSQVEQKNIGAIGPSRQYRERHTVPTEWLPDRIGGAVQLFIQTRAWDMNGRRYSSKEPLIITRDGTPLWR